MKIKHYLYNTFLIESGDKKIAIDPAGLFFYFFRFTTVIPKSEWKDITHIFVTHGDPDKFGVDNPLMKYSEGTISPSVQIHFLNWFHLNIEGGFAFYRNYEFFDGDEKAQSLDLKQT